MYVTRPLSLLRKRPELLNVTPHEGPNSGYLVLFDEECELMITCFGFCREKLWSLPFPQNKNLTICYPTGFGDSSNTYYDSVLFIPVLDQPLSSNKYYVIRRKGRHRGQASASSTEEDKVTCFGFKYIQDVKPRPLDPTDIYQQVEIIPKLNCGFKAVSVAEEGGFPPLYLRRKYWQLELTKPLRYKLDEAPGVNSSLRAQLPNVDFLLSNSSSQTVVVGKWYCPFMFIKEIAAKVKHQVKKSRFYEMTLEQRWDKIFECENAGNNLKVVSVDVFVNREEAFVEEKEAICDWGHVDDGVNWYRSSSDDDKGEDQSGRLLGLSALTMERMRWEQERVGFKVDEFERQVKVKRTEEYNGKEIKGWRKFGCYVLVERFVLKRVDGSVLLTHDFKHTGQIRCKWE